MSTSQVESIAPVVSIGMPVFNGEATVGAAIQSLLAQTLTDFELIVSDNGSSDRTEEICRGLAVTDPRIRYMRQSSNQGATVNFSHVVEAATSDYFMWAAADDVWGEKFLAVCLEGHDKHGDAVAVMTGANFGGDVRDFAGTRPITNRFIFTRQFSFLINPGSNSRFYSLYKMKYLRQIDLKDYQFHAGDWAMIFDLLQFGRFYTEDHYVGFFKADGGAGSEPARQAAYLAERDIPKWFPLLQMTRYVLSKRKLVGPLLLPAIAYLNYTNYKFIYRRR